MNLPPEFLCLGGFVSWTVRAVVGVWLVDPPETEPLTFLLDRFWYSDKYLFML